MVQFWITIVVPPAIQDRSSVGRVILGTVRISSPELASGPLGAFVPLGTVPRPEAS